MIFQPAYSSSGHGWLEPLSTAQGAKQDPPGTGYPYIAGHIHTHPLTQTGAV